MPLIYLELDTFSIYLNIVQNIQTRLFLLAKVVVLLKLLQKFAIVECLTNQ